MVSEDTRIAAADLTTAARIEVRFAPDGHVARFDPASLRAVAADRPKPWGRGFTVPRADYAALRDDPGSLARWLAAVRDYGIAVAAGVPPVDGEVARVAGLFGYVRETNYGRVFDVRADVNPVNLAYSGLALPVHTDNPYREPVPGLQLLHCLANNAEGGDSVVVDGFQAAEVLRRESPDWFALLARHEVPFRYRDAGCELRAHRPLIQVDGSGRVIAVAYNDRSIAPLDLPEGVIAGFYQGYRGFARILRRPELEVHFKLAPGELFIVDNRRVLHGRSAFSGAGRRHLQGCYADLDALHSKLRMLGRAGR